MLFAGFAGALVSDEASADQASTANVTLSDSTVVEGADLTATIIFTEQDESVFSSVSYTAKLVDSDGTTQSSAVSPSSGSLSNGVEKELSITAPSSSGKYTLVVEFTEKITTSDGTQTLDPVTMNRTLSVREPITLSVTVSNNGNLDITDATVYFYVDGVKIDDSKTTLTVAAGEDTTVTYDYFDKDLSSGKHSFYIDSADQAYLINGIGADEKHTFYYDQDSQDIMTYLMAIIFIIVLIVAISVFRKPVKNYGKPKARR